VEDKNKSKVTVLHRPPGTSQQQAITELWWQWLKANKWGDDAFDSPECQFAVMLFSMYLTDHFEDYKALVAGGPAAMLLLAEYHGIVPKPEAS
jgi:hypothetical protein